VRPILILQHEESCPPGLIGDYLRDIGLPVDLRKLHEGDGLPETLSGHAAVVALGGDMNVGEEERFPFLLEERRVLETALRDEVPVLGVCLGAQQLAVAAGGSVRLRDEVEVGWYTIGTAQPDGLLVGIHRRDLVFHWRRYCCLPPQDAVVVAMRDGEPQVFRWGERAWGIQFHPEIDRQTVLGWIADDPETVDRVWRGGVKKLTKMTKRELYRSAVTCGTLMINFLEASGARRRAQGEE